MRIDDVNLFYLSSPVIQDIGDGSQDALLVRVRGEGHVGWGECEASPLVSVANWNCPMSHSACKSVRDAIWGEQIESPEDILRLGTRVRALGLDIAQTDHTWSGVEIALWDWLGKRRGEPVYKLLGYSQAFAKTPYASVLFGDTAPDTYAKAIACREAGYRAAKFGWGPYGRATVQLDAEQIRAAREGLGDDGMLLVDAGTVWCEDVGAAAARLDALEAERAVWLEEPFVGEALHAYRELATHCKRVKLAGGEGASNFHAARNLIDHGGIGYIQIDTGRIGGLGPAKAVADYATSQGVTFVNHTFTTHCALSASLAPFAGIEAAEICEYPVEPSELARSLTKDSLSIKDGQVRLPNAPGLGIEIDEQAVRDHLVDVEIRVQGKTRYTTPEV